MFQEPFQTVGTSAFFVAGCQEIHIPAKGLAFQIQECLQLHHRQLLGVHGASAIDVALILLSRKGWELPLFCLGSHHIHVTQQDQRRQLGFPLRAQPSKQISPSGCGLLMEIGNPLLPEDFLQLLHQRRLVARGIGGIGSYQILEQFHGICFHRFLPPFRKRPKTCLSWAFPPN